MNSKSVIETISVSGSRVYAWEKIFDMEMMCGRMSMRSPERR